MSTTLNTTALLADANAHRLVLQATLVPVMGDLFQPAGFPDIGHVIYDAPRKDGTKEKVCVVDSAASMANHLEAVSLASAQTLELHPDLEGMPYLQCFTDAPGTTGGIAPTRLVVTSLSEGHRLASSYFLDEKGKVIRNNAVSTDNFSTVLRKGFGIQDLGKKTHPLPGDWWNVFRTIFRYDPNSLVHGILFPAMGIKLSRVLTAHHEAFGADRVGLLRRQVRQARKNHLRSANFLSGQRNSPRDSRNFCDRPLAHPLVWTRRTRAEQQPEAIPFRTGALENRAAAVWPLPLSQRLRPSNLQRSLVLRTGRLPNFLRRHFSGTSKQHSETLGLRTRESLRSIGPLTNSSKPAKRKRKTRKKSEDETEDNANE